MTQPIDYAEWESELTSPTKHATNPIGRGWCVVKPDKLRTLIVAAKERDELRAQVEHYSRNDLAQLALTEKAVVELTAARSLLSKAGEALEPFAEQAECWPGEQDDMAMTTTDGIESASLDFRLSDLRAARSVLAEIKDALK